MAFPRNSLRAFLSHAKTSLITAIRQSTKLTFVIGNESADLDSLTASLLYAYFRSLAPPRTAFSPLYIPLINIPASDLRLRPEYTALFHHANISASHLITLDDLPALSVLENTLQPENTRWILVDHNKFQGVLGPIYSSRVHGVIDHHDDEKMVPQKTDPEPRIVQKCGSCTSLVIKYFRPAWETISSASISAGAAHGQDDSLANDTTFSRTWDAQLAKLALASILIDTANLAAAGKVEAVDREAVEYLEARINLSLKDVKTWDRAAFYKNITEAKLDIGALKFDEILRKDYKEWVEGGKKLGISSVVKPLQFMVTKAVEESPQGGERDAFNDAVKNFMNAKDLSVFAIMTTSVSAKGHFRRELLLQTTPNAAPAATKFATDAAADLQLESLQVGGISETADEIGGNAETAMWRRIWLQKDVAKSRKQVAPLLRKALA
ncbi:Exopolyphosphatase [Toensbergia leucococca]|nr:Exopolyphosphatase [Toensbergia leucococca]